MKKIVSMLLVMVMVFTCIPVTAAEAYSDARASGTTNYKVVVKWVGNYGLPGSNMIMLMKNGADPIAKEQPDSKNASGDTWTYNFNNVPIYDQSGRKIEYTVYQEINSSMTGCNYRNYVQELNGTQWTLYNVPTQPFVVDLDMAGEESFFPDRMDYNFKVGNSYVFGPNRDKSLPFGDDRNLFLGPGCGGHYGDWGDNTYLPVCDENERPINYDLVIENTDEYNYTFTRKHQPTTSIYELFEVIGECKKDPKDRIDNINLNIDYPMDYYNASFNVETDSQDFDVSLDRIYGGRDMTEEHIYREGQKYQFFFTCTAKPGKYFGRQALNNVMINGEKVEVGWDGNKTTLTFNVSLTAKPATGQANYTVHTMLFDPVSREYVEYETYEQTGNIGTQPKEDELRTYTGYSFWDVGGNDNIRSDGKASFKVYYGTNRYNLDWDFDGGSPDTYEYTRGEQDYNSDIIAPVPTKKNCFFRGWSPEFTGKMPAMDVTYKAIWERYKPIKEINIILKEPVAGEHPQVAISNDEDYTIETKWFDVGDTFKAGNRPYVSFVIKPAEFHEFVDDTVCKINGIEMEERGYIQNADGTYHISRQYNNLPPLPLGEISFSDAYTKVGENKYQIMGTGKKIEPLPIVKNKKGEILQKGVDYNVTYSSDIIDSGTYTITVTGIGNYVRSEFKIELEVLSNPADYSKVDAALAKIPKDLENYTAETVKPVTDARDAVVRNYDITKQGEVDKMAADIEKAVKNLKFKDADYSKVDAALAKIPKDLSNYTDESVAAVNAAKKAVVRDLNIKQQAEVDKMATAIDTAVKNLKYKDADYSKVDAALAKIPKDLSNYTDESVAAVNAAKKAVVRDLDITKQAEVDEMAKAIEDAVIALEVKEGNVPVGNIGTISLNSYFYKVNDVTFRGAYNGNQMKAAPIVKNEQGEVLKEGVDYEVTYSSDKRVAVGAYKFTVTGIGLYTGEITCKLIITPKAVSDVNVRLGAYNNNGGGYDDAYVTWAKSEGADGYYVYMRRPNIKDNAWVSLGTVKGTSLLKKDLADGYKYEFKVLPYVQDNMKYRTTGKFKVADVQTLMKAKINTVKKYNNVRTRLTWTNVRGVTGYQVMVSAKGNTRYFTINSPAANAKVVKNAKTTFKVRAYKDVKNNSGKTVRVYAPWSDARTYTLR